MRNPITVMSPAKSCSCANASGIMVSTSIDKIAPAATAMVAAITLALKCRKAVYPTNAAIPEITAIAPHTPNTYLRERPACFIPAELESPSGTFERKTAATVTRLTAPPEIMLTPMAIDSGIPSSKAPTAIANPLPSLSCSDGCWSPERLRCFAPFFERYQLANVYTTDPLTKPSAQAANPPRLNASSIKSKASAEINTPLPNAMMAATVLCLMLEKYPIPAPTNNAEPPNNPQRSDSNDVGIFDPC